MQRCLLSYDTEAVPPAPTARAQAFSVQMIFQLLSVAVLAGLFWLQKANKETVVSARDTLGEPGSCSIACWRTFVACVMSPADIAFGSGWRCPGSALTVPLHPPPHACRPALLLAHVPLHQVSWVSTARGGGMLQAVEGCACMRSRTAGQ